MRECCIIVIQNREENIDTPVLFTLYRIFCWAGEHVMSFDLKAHAHKHTHRHNQTPHIAISISKHCTCITGSSRWDTNIITFAYGLVASYVKHTCTQHTHTLPSSASPNNRPHLFPCALGPLIIMRTMGVVCGCSALVYVRRGGDVIKRSFRITVCVYRM